MLSSIHTIKKAIYFTSTELKPHRQRAKTDMMISKKWWNNTLWGEKGGNSPSLSRFLGVLKFQPHYLF